MFSPRKRILCVDDHQDSCEMMKVFLEMWNYEVALANTTAEGLRLSQSQHFDLYLLDTNLPEVSGFKLCKQICAVPGHAPVVFLSGAAYETDKQHGRQSGAVAYFTKPVDFDALKTALIRLLPQTPGKGHRKLLQASPLITAHAQLTTAKAK